MCLHCVNTTNYASGYVNKYICNVKPKSCVYICVWICVNYNWIVI